MAKNKRERAMEAILVTFDRELREDLAVRLEAVEQELKEEG